MILANVAARFSQPIQPFIAGAFIALLFCTVLVGLAWDRTTPYVRGVLVAATFIITAAVGLIFNEVFPQK